MIINNEKKKDYLIIIFSRDRPTLSTFSSQLSILTFVKSKYKIYFKSIFVYLYTQICINLIYSI